MASSSPPPSPLVEPALARRWRAPPLDPPTRAHRTSRRRVHLSDQALGHHVGRFAGTPTVVTCHDVMPFVVPNFYRNPRVGRIKRRLLQHSIHGMLRATRIIAVSARTADDLSASLQLPAVTHLHRAQISSATNSTPSRARKHHWQPTGSSCPTPANTQRGALRRVQEPRTADRRPRHPVARVRRRCARWLANHAAATSARRKPWRPRAHRRTRPRLQRTARPGLLIVRRAGAAECLRRVRRPGHRSDGLRPPRRVQRRRHRTLDTREGIFVQFGDNLGLVKSAQPGDGLLQHLTD